MELIFRPQVSSINVFLHGLRVNKKWMVDVSGRLLHPLDFSFQGVVWRLEKLSRNRICPVPKFSRVPVQRKFLADNFYAQIQQSSIFWWFGADLIWFGANTLGAKPGSPSLRRRHGLNFKLPFMEWPIIYDSRTKPSEQTRCHTVDIKSIIALPFQVFFEKSFKKNSHSES